MKNLRTTQITHLISSNHDEADRQDLLTCCTERLEHLSYDMLDKVFIALDVCATVCSESPMEAARKNGNKWLLTYKGQTLGLSAWSKLTGISYQTLLVRVHAGWPVERALSQAV